MIFSLFIFKNDCLLYVVFHIFFNPTDIGREKLFGYLVLFFLCLFLRMIVCYMLCFTFF